MRERETSERCFEKIRGSCPLIEQARSLAFRASQTDYPILLQGGSGTGKELFAQAIHNASSRATKPFIAINCSAIPESLIESELFGYTSGSFTGANRHGNKGKFLAASGGTLFLDEIGDMEQRAQAAILRALQEQQITPLGSNQSIPVNVRIIAATHRDLLEEIRSGRFRSDLYYRLKVIGITLPLLKNRSDLVDLAERFLVEHDYPHPQLCLSVRDAILSHNWPGNMRELKNVMLQAAFLANGQPIETSHLCIDPLQEDHEENLPFQNVVPIRSLHDDAIRHALQQTDWNIKRTSELLGIGRNTLYRKMHAYGIQRGPDQIIHRSRV